MSGDGTLTDTNDKKLLYNTAKSSFITALSSACSDIATDTGSKYTYQTKQDVKEKMQQESDVFNTVLETWEEEDSPLKDTFQVKVKDIEKISKTAEKIQRMDKVAVLFFIDHSAHKGDQLFRSAHIICCLLCDLFHVVHSIRLSPCT